jgi:hypothetical protein
MYYVLVTQGGRIMPDCFTRGRFSLHDGPLQFYIINSRGIISDACEGTVFDCNFHEE